MHNENRRRHGLNVSLPLFASLLLSSAVIANAGWKNQAGEAVAETESRKSVGGFGGLLVVTPDEDWEEKWNTPAEVAPQFSGSSTVERGGKLFILMIYANPAPDDAGVVNITADIDVQRPDGSSSVHVEGASCYQGKLGGPPEHAYLCGPVIGFVGEPTDPLGTWSVRVTLTDQNRKVSVPLSTAFELKGDE